MTNFFRKFNKNTSLNLNIALSITLLFLKVGNCSVFTHFTVGTNLEMKMSIN